MMCSFSQLLGSPVWQVQPHSLTLAKASDEAGLEQNPKVLEGITTWRQLGFSNWVVGRHFCLLTLQTLVFEAVRSGVIFGTVLNITSNHTKALLCSDVCDVHTWPCLA